MLANLIMPIMICALPAYAAVRCALEDFMGLDLLT